MKASIVTPQAQAIYDVLQQHGEPMTAEQIATNLHILSPTVYRAATQLINIGLVQKTKAYPISFMALDPKAGMSWYLLHAQKAFKETFGESNSMIDHKQQTSLSIVKNRDDFLQKTTVDAAQATGTIDFIVSGLEVPDKTILTYRKIIAHGITVRAIVQQRHETSKQRLEDWKSIGVEVRYASNVGLRLFIVDKSITYLVAYNPAQPQQSLGVRYNYAPLSNSMHDFFEQQWALSQPT